MNRLISIPGALTLALLIGGCAAHQEQASIESWQKSLEEYVWKECNGDPGGLRDVTLDSSRKGFALLGELDPTKAVDAHGLLLGHRQIGGRNWFIYLVALVSNYTTQEIRLAAVSSDGQHLAWAMGTPDEAATAAYQRFKTDAWQKLYAHHPVPPPGYRGFADDEDAFDLTITGQSLTARHLPSSAQWTLTLPPDQRFAGRP